jgi:hypothetical protein
MQSIQDLLRGALVVSCQAAPGNPLDDTEAIRRMCLAVLENGARGLRLNSPEHIEALRRHTAVPIIGIQKRYRDGELFITPDFESAVRLAAAGASIIALDCTRSTKGRVWSPGTSWKTLIERIHRELKLPVMADIATLDEARAAAAAGADHPEWIYRGNSRRTFLRLEPALVSDTGTIGSHHRRGPHIGPGFGAARDLSRRMVRRRRLRNHPPWCNHCEIRTGND